MGALCLILPNRLWNVSDFILNRIYQEQKKKYVGGEDDPTHDPQSMGNSYAKNNNTSLKKILQVDKTQKLILFLTTSSSART